MSLSNHLHHIVHAHAPYSVGLWRSPSLRAKQPCSSPRWHENKFLNADIYIVRNESDKKTAREALHNWKSTYAVKHLRTVIEEAKPLEGQPLFVSRKEGEQKRNGYKNMILLYHHFVNEEKDYLDFVVKLTIGVMTGGKHVQYCVNKIEVQ